MIELTSLALEASPQTTSAILTRANHWDHILARLGWRRGRHLVKPGLYALGSPNPESPVFVTANYTLSFDALRSVLAGQDAYILVLDTKGINVWCAAGKGTFGTDEIVARVFSSGLKSVVSHRRLILPQLGAPGVSAPLVKRRTGFQVEYGPIRASDLPEYLKTHQATPAMRRVEFPLRDRLVLIPVDIVQTLPWVLGAMLVFGLLGGWLSAFAALSVFLAGVVLFPMLLPVLPSHDFSMKGFLLGGLAALLFAAAGFLRHPDWLWWKQTMLALHYLLAMPAAVAFITLNFTGATTFTSRSGVRKEIYRYIPIMAWMFGIGLLLGIVIRFIK
jgi:hypothetical protein